MKVVCAWCEKEGHPSLLAVWPPTDDCRVSHGICESHAASYRKSLSSGEKAHITTKLRDRIAVCAYALYEVRGYRHDCELQDWLDAEREILSHQNQP